MPKNENADVVEVRITIAARPETIFAFVSNPADFRRWMGDGSALVPSVGGAVRVVYPNGDAAGGVVEELIANEKVVMSWGYESGAHGVPLGSTRVEITLAPIAGGTRVTLRHSGLRDAGQRANHRAGWRHSLASLSQLSSAHLDGIIDAAIDTYTAAWAATDPADRARLLTECFDVDGVFRDCMGYVEGPDDLSDYIGMAQRFSAGITLERLGAISRAHAFASYRWRMVTSDGTPVLTGSNTAEFSADGRMRSMTGFWDAIPK